jgi:hypothetical protein
MTTVSQLIKDSAIALGYLGRNEVMSAQDINDALRVFNRMLDSWSNESLASYVQTQRSFPTVFMKNAYTIGSGGDINDTRPADIISAFIRDTNNIDYKLQVLTQQQWDDIGQKTITSQIPDQLYYESTYPLGTIYIFPYPLIAGYTVFYRTNLNQVEATALTNTISMPVGYELAYTLNLAVQMMSAGFPCMLEGPSLAMLIKGAADAKAAIKASNIDEVVAAYDDAIVSRSNATYNVYSDRQGRN